MDESETEEGQDAAPFYEGPRAGPRVFAFSVYDADAERAAGKGGNGTLGRCVGVPGWGGNWAGAWNGFRGEGLRSSHGAEAPWQAHAQACTCMCARVTNVMVGG